MQTAWTDWLPWNWDIDVDPEAWLESLIERILDLGRSSFGNSTMDIAERLANESLLVENVEHWEIWAITYGLILVVGSTVAIFSGGTRFAFAGSDIERVRKGKRDVMQVGHLFAAGIIIPVALATLVIIADAFRKVPLLAYELLRDSEEPWYAVFANILVPIVDPDRFFIDLALGGLTNNLIDMNLAIIGKMLGSFSILILIAYAFRRNRLGAGLLRLLIGIVIGLLSALPIQVAILVLAAMMPDPTFRTTLVATTLVALLPIILTIIWTIYNPYARISGGRMSIDEGNLETTSSDEPVPVVVTEGEVDADISSSQPIEVNVSGQVSSDLDGTMVPQIDGADGETLVANRHRKDVAEDIAWTVLKATPAIAQAVGYGTGPVGKVAGVVVSTGAGYAMDKHKERRREQKEGKSKPQDS